MGIIELGLNILYLIGFIFVWWIIFKVFDKISNNRGIRDFFNRENTKRKIEKVKSFIEKVKSFFSKVFAVSFLITIIIGVVSYIQNPDLKQFPEFTLKLAIAGLTLGAFSIAMAALINQARQRQLSQEAMRYRHFSEDFIVSGVYFIFSYFFWLVKNFYPSTNSRLYPILIQIYTILMYIAVAVGTILIIKSMWHLLKENV